MITVACLLWGDWCAPHGERYVRAMKASVAFHLSLEHRFVCLSDREIEGVETLPLPVSHWKRHLPKLWLYAPENGLTGRVLALDLDDIPVGPLDALAAYDGRFCCVEDPWEFERLAGGGPASFEAGDPVLAERLYQPFVEDMDAAWKLCKGFDRYLYRNVMPDADLWPREWIADAKPQGTREIIDSIPRGTRIAHFHGKPRPHEVQRAWLDSHWNRKEIE